MQIRSARTVRLVAATAVLAVLGGLLTSCEVDSGFGYFDSAKVNADGTVKVQGWAATFLGATVDVTIVANGVHHRIGAATKQRPDVGAKFPKHGPGHGFDTNLKLPAGKQKLCAYATGSEGTVSLLSNCFDVVVPKPTKPPAPTTTLPPVVPTGCATKQTGNPYQPVRMVIENTTGHPANEVYVTLTGKNAGTPVAQWDANPRNIVNNSIKLSCLPKDTTDSSGNSYYFDLGKGISAGLLWVSVGTPIPTGTNGLPNVQPSTDTTDYVFANVEFAYPGQGDVTNVDQFSMPINLTVTDGPNQSSTGFNTSTCDIVAGLFDEVVTYNDRYITPFGPLATEYASDWDQIVVKNSEDKIIRVLSAKARAQQPKTSPGGAPNPYASGWPDLTPYIESLENEELVFEGLFSPSPQNPNVSEKGWYRYTGTVDESGQLILDGTIQATTTPGGTGSVDGDEFRVDVNGYDTNLDGDIVGNNDLATGIYFQNSRYFVAGTARNGLTMGVPEEAAPDDVYNTIYRDVVTALSYGYPGEVYGYDNTNYWESWSPPEAPHGGKAAFSEAHPDETDFLGYNLWSETMYQWSDNYNIPYGENYGTGAVNRPSPLLDVPSGGTWKMTLGAPVSDCADPADSSA